MSRSFLTPAAALFCLAALAGPAGATDDTDASLRTAIAGTATPAITMLVMRDGKIAETGVAGVRRNDKSDPARIDDAWLIGSDAKPMTAALIARLVDRGVLSWDAPLSLMLPELAAGMRPEYRSVTLVQLLSHRAGLPENLSDMAYFNTFYADPRPPREQRMAYLARAVAEAPGGPAGTFSYSNTGFLLAAAIAEHAAGASYEDLVRREVFQPLGMTSVAFGTTGDGEPQGHHAGKPATLTDANPLMFAPAGNLHLTMRDWAAFCLDQMAGYHGGGKLLKPATYRMMETRLPGTEGGLAWGVRDSLAGRKGPVLMHAGSDGNWYAVVALFPETQNGILAAANAGEDMGGDAAVKAAMMAVLPGLAPAADPTP
ncbi:MAG TPA: serine hydrolase domain-containing protein [Rhizomicrobium sp.]